MCRMTHLVSSSVTSRHLRPGNLHSSKQSTHHIPGRTSPASPVRCACGASCSVAFDDQHASQRTHSTRTAASSRHVWARIQPRPRREARPGPEGRYASAIPRSKETSWVDRIPAMTGKRTSEKASERCRANTILAETHNKRSPAPCTEGSIHATHLEPLPAPRVGLVEARGCCEPPCTGGGRRGAVDVLMSVSGGVAAGAPG